MSGTGATKVENPRDERGNHDAGFAPDFAAARASYIEHGTLTAVDPDGKQRDRGWMVDGGGRWTVESG
ncbi:hypothetical protein [Streptomyces sp. NPDC056544]|uniref:hypothetical protein n=1 Tax=unclassified Streptomyces TaxID=2593676 RepID=UPI00368D729E